MSSNDARRRERSSWRAAGIVLLLCFGGGVLTYVTWPDPVPTVPGRSYANISPVKPPPVRTAPAAPTSPTAKATAPSPPKAATPNAGPSFDVVRVGPQGLAVIAGRADRDATVTVYDGSRVLGETRADAQGQFVMLPTVALSSGMRELTLSARGADGVEVAGSGSVFLDVPKSTTAVASVGPTPVAANSPPVAVLVPHDAGSPRVLGGQGKGGKLGLDTVDYDENGEIRFAGSAKATTPVRVYVDNKPVGEATAADGGQWSLVPTQPVAPGVHQLRVDQLGPDGRVLGRVELPFQRVAQSPEKLAVGQTIVQPGQNLWRIARQSYGQGTRYTVIYLANRDQIRDPNRIYPGQIFSMPPSL